MCAHMHGIVLSLGMGVCMWDCVFDMLMFLQSLMQ